MTSPYQTGKGTIDLLDVGQVWVGFNDAGVSVAASVARLKPAKSGAIFGECDLILKCYMPDDGIIFGKRPDEFKIAPRQRWRLSA